MRESEVLPVLISTRALEKAYGISRREISRILRSQKAQEVNEYEHFYLKATRTGSKDRIDHKRFYKLLMEGQIG